MAQPIYPQSPILVDFSHPSLTDLAQTAVLKNIENKLSGPREKTMTEKFLDWIGFTSQSQQVPTIAEWKALQLFMKTGESVNHTMQAIEESVLADFEPYGGDPSSFLQTQVTTLFQKLKKAYPIPLTDLPSIQAWEDDALQKIWNHLSWKNPQQFPAMNNVKEIKTWFEDPKNEVHLLSLTHLFITDDLGIKAIPSQLRKCRNLMRLEIVGNKIAFIPEWIGDLTKLSWIRLDYNQITVIPDSIANLKELEELHLTYNQIRVLPDTMQHLALSDLLLHNNQIEVIPDWFVNMFPKKGYCYVSLHHNKIRYIPETLKNFSITGTFYISHNHITYIPDWAKTLLWPRYGDTSHISTTNLDISIDLTSYNISNAT